MQKKKVDEPLQAPVLVEKIDDSRTSAPGTLTAIIVVDNVRANLGREHAPYFVIRTMLFRLDPRFMTPVQLANHSYAHPMFFVGKSDEEIQTELERALTKIGLWP